MELGFFEPVQYALHSAASLLTDPLCKAHLCFRRLSTVDQLHPRASALENRARKVALLTQMIGYALLATLMTAPGIVLRAVAIQLRANSYLKWKENVGQKALPMQRTFTVLSWNVCAAPAGYGISDGGVVGKASRVYRIARKILAKDPDVVCLYELFDVRSAAKLCRLLKKSGYQQGYFHMGAKAIGVSSGLFVASKFRIKNAQFIPFPKEALHGRAKNSSKGIFAFDLKSRDEGFARIFSTHLQHSEEPSFPTAQEVLARKKEMEMVVKKVKQLRQGCAIVTGDLNLDDREYKDSLWADKFIKKTPFSFSGQKSWGGDAWCARLVGKRVSRPLNLDHTLVLKGTGRVKSTRFVKSYFDPERIKRKALSDHCGLFSTIKV